MGNNLAVQLFHVMCMIFTISLTAYCFYQYASNEDIAKVDYKEFQSTEADIYPSASFCFDHPFDQFKIDKLGNGLNASILEQLIAGKNDLYDRVVDLKYDEVTFDLNDHLIKVEIKPTWRQKIVYNNDRLNEKPVFYVSKRNSMEKCFVLDVPYIERETIDYVEVSINFTAFVFDYVAYRNPKLLMHYPNQSMSAAILFPPLPFYSISINGFLKRTLGVVVYVAHVDVLKRRNKPNKPCNTDWKHQDGLILDAFLSDLGCKPFYLQSSLELPVCTKNVEYSQFDLESRKEEKKPIHHTGPCREIQKLFHQFQFDTDFRNWTQAKKEPEKFLAVENQIPFTFKIYFQGSTYKLIEHVKAYDFQSLVGNVGGYIGMFLGYSLLEVPGSLSILFSKMVGKLTFMRERLATIRG
jgi:hypothetical protein